MIKEGKVRVMITMEKNSQDIIREFAGAVKMTFSEFVEGVCLKFIEEVIAKKQNEKQDKTEA